MKIEKIAAMRRLILDIDTHQIPDEFIQARGKEIATEADIDSLIDDFNASKKAAMSKDEQQAEADINNWSSKK